MDTNELYDTDNAYKLTNIKEVDIQVKNWEPLCLEGNLYIQKYGSYYVIFQKSSSLKYTFTHLKEIMQAIELSGATISFINSVNDYYNKNFYSDKIKFVFVTDIRHDLKCYIPAIFIPISCTDFGLQKYVSNLYNIYHLYMIDHDVATYDKGTSISYNSSSSCTRAPAAAGCKFTGRYGNKSVIGEIVADIESITMQESIFKIPDIKNVIFNDPATIVFWDDGSKTVVKTQNNEKYDKEKGLAMAISKKMSGNNSKYYDTFKKWIK